MARLNVERKPRDIDVTVSLGLFETRIPLTLAVGMNKHVLRQWRYFVYFCYLRTNINHRTHTTYILVIANHERNGIIHRQNGRIKIISVHFDIISTSLSISIASAALMVQKIRLSHLSVRKSELWQNGRGGQITRHIVI